MPLNAEDRALFAARRARVMEAMDGGVLLLPASVSYTHLTLPTILLV